MTTALRWRLSRRALALLALAVTALALAALTARPEPLALTVPLLVTVAAAARRGRPPTHVLLRADRPTEWCFEHEPVSVTLTATTPGGEATVSLHPLTVPAITLIPADRHRTSPSTRAPGTPRPTPHGARWTLRLTRRAARPAPPATEPDPPPTNTPSTTPTHNIEPTPPASQDARWILRLIRRARRRPHPAAGPDPVATNTHQMPQSHPHNRSTATPPTTAPHSPVPAGISRWTVRADRWGRFSVPVGVTARAGAGLLVAIAVAEALEVRAYPRPAPLRVTVRPDELAARLGVHIGRYRGAGGVEFAGIRPYQPGDPVNRLNWRVSSRLARPHITERLGERAADVVALVDIYPVAPAARAGLDLAVRGAAEVVQAALRRGDRAGVLALGGIPRWLGPETGRRQFYRIVDAVLDASSAYPATPTPGDRVPRTALPPRSCVIAFTPLLDARVGLTVEDLRGRGHAVLVIDVLRRPALDPADRPDPLTEQLWRMERRALHRDFARAGIPVLPWPEDATLDQVLLPQSRRPLPTGRTRH